MTAFDEVFADELAAVPDEHFDRERFVPGDGPVDADVMLVGEAPGGNEIYVTNLVKVRPPENRGPHVAETDAWWPVLRAEVERVDPDVIVPLGSFAAGETLDSDETITDLRGRAFERDGRTVRPTFHPAAALYDRSKRPTIVDDLRAALAERDE